MPKPLPIHECKEQDALKEQLDDLLDELKNCLSTDDAINRANGELALKENEKLRDTLIQILESLGDPITAIREIERILGVSVAVSIDPAHPKSGSIEGIQTVTVKGSISDEDLANIYKGLEQSAMETPREFTIPGNRLANIDTLKENLKKD